MFWITKVYCLLRIQNKESKFKKVTFLGLYKLNLYSKDPAAVGYELRETWNLIQDRDIDCSQGQTCSQDHTCRVLWHQRAFALARSVVSNSYDDLLQPSRGKGQHKLIQTLLAVQQG